MYCKHCYADLTHAADNRCPKCERTFDPATPGTYLNRPFPSTSKIIGQVVFTTVLAVIAAGIIAFHQLARSSGH